jgi:transporter family-2 protein
MPPAARNHFFESLKNYAKAVELRPKEPLYHFSLGWMNEQGARFSKDLSQPAYHWLDAALIEFRAAYRLAPAPLIEISPGKFAHISGHIYLKFEAAQFTQLGGFAPGKAAQVPWWAWLGGLLSIMSTMAGLMLAEKMGSMFFTATTVPCSMVCSVLLDHFGWVRFEVHRVNPWRLAGCAMLLAGLFLVSKF